MNTQKTRFAALVALVFAAALSRLLPHPPNFSPIAGIALFGAAYFSEKRWALVVPFLAMLLSDVIIGFHALMPVVYVAFAAIVWMGTRLLKQVSLPRAAGASLLASTAFFVLTNLGVWVFGEGIYYPLTAAGLAECFTMALPFFGPTIAGDLFFVTVMFGGFALLQRSFAALRA